MLELLQHIHLLLLIARRLARLLLPLVPHHLFHHTPRLPVQVTQLAVLRGDLRGVDLGRGSHDMSPPLHLVDLVEVDVNLLAGGGCFQRPGGFVYMDWVGEGALVSY